MSSDFDIDRRTGLPDELCVLLSEYPRTSWSRNVTPLAQFWIARHDEFRDQCSILENRVDDFRERSANARDFVDEAASRTRFLIAFLEGHHQVEDFHYFPAFRAADPRLDRGFEVLAGDHRILHETGISVFTALDAFRNTPGDVVQTADNFAGAIELLCRRIVRHLEDEEDLIIPLMLRMGSGP